MPEKSLKIGDTLYRILGNRSAPKTIAPHTVATIGRKYFTITGDTRRKFAIDTLLYTCQDCHQNNVQLYRSEQEIKDSWAADELRGKIGEFFRFGNRKASLEQLQGIAEILQLK